MAKEQGFNREVLLGLRALARRMYALAELETSSARDDILRLAEDIEKEANELELIVVDHDDYPR